MVTVVLTCAVSPPATLYPQSIKEMVNVQVKPKGLWEVSLSKGGRKVLRNTSVRGNSF